MKIVKGLQASLMTKTFQFQHKQFLVASNLWGFYLDTGEAILEMKLWPIIADVIGENVLFDEATNKDGSEFIVFGDAFAPNQQPAPSVDVAVRVGKLKKVLSVHGERYWQGAGPLLHASAAVPFSQMPLSYDHAYGGERHQYNTAGKGLAKESPDQPLRFLPNIEHPSLPILAADLDPADRAYVPQGFGPIDGEWPQRRSLFGTFDDSYLQNHMPGLAPDINWEYFYRAPPDQRFNDYVVGDESFSITNMHPSMPILEGTLPGVVGRCFIEQEVTLDTAEGGGEAGTGDEDNTLISFKEIPLKLDTIYFFPNENVGIVAHRGTVEINHPQAKDVKKLMIVHQGLTDAPKSKDYYQEQLSLRSDPEESFKYMMYSAPLIPEGVRCGFKQLLGDEEYTQAMGANMSAFAEKKQQQAEQQMAEGIDAQVAELRANDMHEQADELLKKVNQPPQDIDLPEDQKKLKALIDKVLPGIGDMTSAPKLDDLDLTKLNLKAMDDVTAHMQAMAEAQKVLAFKQLEEQVVQLKQQLAQQPDMAEQLEPAIKQLEDLIAGTNSIPVLARPNAIELEAQLAQAAEQLAEQKKMIAEENIQLTAEQQQQLQELEQQLNDNSLLEQVQKANEFSSNAYLQGAHFIPESASPHQGEEPALVAALLASYAGNQVISAKDLAFCTLKQQTFNNIDLNHGFFEYSQLTDIQFNQSDLTAINFAHATLSGVRFTHCLIEGANLGAAQISHCHFSHLNLNEITLAHSTLSHCEFTDCEFGERMDMLLETKMSHCRFINCHFPKLNFIEMDLTGCEFINCDLTKCNFIKPILIGASFQGSTLESTNFVKAQLDNSSFDQAVMKNVRFVGGCSLNDSRFNGASITDSNLRDCQLNRCDFADADLSRSDFGESSIRQAKFNRAIAKKTQFINSNLHGSDLNGADFMEASLMQADIRACDFSYANLYSASFLKATLGETLFVGAILDNTLLVDWRPA